MRSLIYILFMLIITLVIKVRAEVPIKQHQLTVINEAAIAYGVSPDKLVRIAYVESRFNENAIRHNRNGTTDIGIFQINTVHISRTCKEYNIGTLYGNTYCAAKLLAIHKKHKYKDSKWHARFHSKTPSLKHKYYLKLQAVPTIKVAYHD